MKTYESKQPIPLVARIIIRKYAPTVRAAIFEAVRERIQSAEAEGRRLTAEEIGECAYDALFAPHKVNMAMADLCLEAYRNGDRTTIQDVIDELESSVS